MKPKSEPDTVRGIFGLFCCGCHVWRDYLIRTSLSRYRCPKCVGRP